MAESNQGVAHERRHAPRERVLQRGEIVIGPTVQACIVLDLTPRGARLETAVPLSLPDRFGLRFPDGRRMLCVRRWAVGRRVGAEFLDAEAVPGGRTERAETILRLQESSPASRVFGTLRAEHFLGSSGLADATADAEAAWSRLTVTLRSLAAASDRGPGQGGD